LNVLSSQTECSCAARRQRSCVGKGHLPSGKSCRLTRTIGHCVDRRLGSFLIQVYLASPFAGSTIVWKKDISPADGLQALQVDPHDRRHLCLCGGRGALTVLKLLNPARDRRVLACWYMAADLVCSVSGKIERLHRRLWLNFKLHIAAHSGEPRQ